MTDLTFHIGDRLLDNNPENNKRILTIEGVFNDYVTAGKNCGIRTRISNKAIGVYTGKFSSRDWTLLPADTATTSEIGALLAARNLLTQTAIAGANTPEKLPEAKARKLLLDLANILLQAPSA